MKKLLPILAMSLLSLMNLSLIAQQKVIKVWADKIPGAIKSSTYQEEFLLDDNQTTRISKVTEPTLTIYEPPKEITNGAAIIICPGGGYARLSIDREGFQIASWFSKRGITAIILKYRLPSDEIMKDKSIGPLEDAQEAIRIVRRHAKEWG